MDNNKMKRIEAAVFALCGVLAVVFVVLLITFVQRKGEVNTSASAGETVTTENLASQIPGEEPVGQEENAVSRDESATGSTAVSGAETEGANENADSSDGEAESTTQGEPITFSSNASQDRTGDWLFVEGNQIVDRDGKPVWLTGINWFGYNTGTNCFDGLWACDLNTSIAAIADHGFNLLRIPISTQLLLQWKNGEYPTANFNQATNSYLVGMNSLEIFDYVLQLCEQNGIKVMLDVHCAVTNAAGHNVNLWYDGDISEEDFIEAWVWVAERYADNDTLIAFDLENEPHGKPYEQNRAIWNDSTDPNNWPYVASKTAAAIFEVNPNVLIMVEGIEIYPMDIISNGDYHSTDENDYHFAWWGGNLRGVADYPIDLGEFNNKLVYSPHDYGPTVYQQPWFYDGYNYDTMMADYWYDTWFFIYDQEIAPLLVGEWGGFMAEPNITWMTHMRTLIGNYHLHHTFWCFNANSGDTGGLVLDDFVTWDEEKYAFVREVLWQQNGYFVGLDHEVPLGQNGITLSDAYVENW